MVARHARPAASLRALTLDRIARRLLETHASWTVHSVFARAANLRSTDGDLLGLVLAPAPNGPATVILEDDGHLEPLSEWLTVGALVSGRPPPPSPLPRKRERGGLEVEISGAERWAPAPLVRRLDVEAVLRRVGEAAGLAAEGPVQGGLARLLGDFRLASPSCPSPCRGGEGEPASTRSASPAKRGLPEWPGGGDQSDKRGRRLPGRDLVAQQGRASLEAITHGWLTGDLDAFGEGCRQLSGLGPGLTPSGDDLLAGLTLGLRAALGTLLDPAGDAIRAATDGRTTDLAAARVRHAVHGAADEYADAVLRALVMDADADLEVAVRRLLDYGHTSGADTLVGLLAGVRLGLAGSIAS